MFRSVVAVALFGLLLLSQSTPSLAASCSKPSKRPKIIIDYLLPDAEYVYSVDEEGMQDLTDTYAGYTHGPWHVPMGLTTAEFGAHYETQFNIRKATGGYCVSLHQANVTVGYRDHTIFVTPKYDEDSCEFNAILDHEAEHAAINLETLRTYQGKIKKALNRIAVGKRSIFAYSKGQARSAYVAEIKKQLEPVLNAFGHTRAQRHARIDNRDSYERVYALCDNW